LACRELVSSRVETIGIDLELEDKEKAVGALKADILAKDAFTGDWVLIENQLERTDHSHLGQLLTYASGLQAFTIIWIAAKFTDEHRAALDWLNEVTNESIRFFGLEIELWRIDEGVAPKFTIVCKPNTWKQRVTADVKNAVPQTVERSKLSTSRQVILDLFHTVYPSPLTPVEIAEKTGIPRKTVVALLLRMQSSGQVMNTARGLYMLTKEYGPGEEESCLLYLH
jgi:hypothetical protein